MKYQCDIIKDLLPLYHDEVCSNESRIVVQEHLSECEACSEYLDNLNSADIMTAAEKNEEREKASMLNGLKIKLFRKKVMVSVISVLCAIALMFGAFSFISLYETPVKYSDGLVKVEMAYDGVIDVFYQGRDYHCVYGMTKRLTKNGETIDVAYIYYTDTIWSKLISRAHQPGTLQFSIGNTMNDYGHEREKIESEEFDAEEEIEAVYYLVGDYTELVSMDEEEFLELAKNATLLWER